MSSQPNKKRKFEEQKHHDIKPEENTDESEDSEEDSEPFDSDDSEDNQFINKQIDVDFSAYQPIDEDFNGIKCLLSQLWLKERINITELAHLLIQQKGISSVLKQEIEEEEEEEDKEEDKEEEEETDEDDVYGITSVIPLREYLQKESINQIKTTLLSYLPKVNEIETKLRDNSLNIGFVINERFTNLPPKISLPSYQQLINDLKSAQNDKQNKLNLEFEWILMVCKILKTKTNSKKPIESQLIYVNAEEEIFHDFCDHSFEYSVAKQCDSDVFDWKDDNTLLEPFRQIILLKNENWNKAIIKLNEEFK